METKDTALLAKLRGLFAIEADEHLQAITSNLLTLETTGDGATAQECIETLFREVHTLKGAARAVNLHDVEAICQVVESVCAALKRQEFRVWPEFFDTLHRTMDVVRQLSASEGTGLASVADLVAELGQLEAQGRALATTPVLSSLVHEQTGISSYSRAQETRHSSLEGGEQDPLLAKLRGLFAIEADEHLQAITSNLLTLETTGDGATAQECIETLFREVHTLKGAARAVNLHDVEAICQVVESVCAALKRQEFRVWPEFFDTLHRTMDVVRQLSASEGTGLASVADLVAELGQLEAQGRALATTPARVTSHEDQPASLGVLDSSSPDQETALETPPTGEHQLPVESAVDTVEEAAPQGLQPMLVEEEPISNGNGKRRRTTTPRKTTTRRPRATKKNGATSEAATLTVAGRAEQESAEPITATTIDLLRETPSLKTWEPAAESLDATPTEDETQEQFSGEPLLTPTASPSNEDQAQQKMLTRLRGLFAIEADEHLQVIIDTLLGLEHEQSSTAEDELLETLFRRIHTLKGAARAVNLHDIEAICQVVESVCAALKRKEFGVWAEFFDTLHRMTDLVRQLSNEPEGPSRDKVAEMLAEVGQLETQGRERSQASQKAEAQFSSAPSSELPSLAKEEKRETFPEEDREKERAAALQLSTPNKAPAPAISPIFPKKSSASQDKGAGAKKTTPSAETVRIQASKLDALFLQAEEMLAVKLKTSLHATELRGLATMLEAWRREWAKVHTDIRKTQRLLEKEENRSTQDPIYVQAAKLVDFLDWTHDHLKALDKTLSQVTRAVVQDQQSLGGMVDILLEDAKKVLMLPFASALEVLPKMVRDLSRAQGKEVDFTLQGGEVEIDKRILEELKDPLIHILRNCIDHGIENPTEREHKQKPTRGSISIAIAPSDGNTVEIVVTDDGAGIHASKVREAAVKCGLLSRKAAEQLPDQEAIALIFQSEVSTSSTVSDISGRGLGMAIVREKVEKLGGQIAVETQPHHGSMFRIRLPLTLATFRGIQVQTSGQVFVVPTANVERVVRVNRNDIHTVGNKETISLAGYTLPLIRLDQALGLPTRAKNTEPGRFQLALVIGQDERQIAFGVDVVMSEQEVLFKSLGKQLVRVRNIAGATVLGSGQVVPVLNISDLLASAGGNSLSLAVTTIETPNEESAKRSILVAEDSITSRMLLKEILESAGYAVSTAIDGEDAFSTLQKSNFDLVVSDVEMPRMNGFALTSRIRGDDRYTQLPVVLVTGLESQADRERGIDAGANAYVVKGSFDQSNLLETIRRLI